MHALAHVLDDQERAKAVKVRFDTTGRAGRADLAIHIQTGAEDWRTAHAPRNFPGEAARRGHATDLSLRVDPVAIDRAVEVLRVDQSFRHHFSQDFAAGFGTLLRIEVMLGIDPPFPFQPKLP